MGLTHYSAIGIFPLRDPYRSCGRRVESASLTGNMDGSTAHRWVIVTQPTWWLAMWALSARRSPILTWACTAYRPPLGKKFNIISGEGWENMHPITVKAVPETVSEIPGTETAQRPRRWSLASIPTS